MAEKNNLAELMTATMGKIRDMVDVNTIVGEAISTPDGTTIIPVSRLSAGFGTGGTEYGQGNNFGGGSGGGIKVAPVAFLIVTPHSVKLLPVTGTTETAFDKIVDLIPKAIKQVEGFIEKRKNKDDSM